MSDGPDRIALAQEELERLMKDRFERPMPKRFYEQVTVGGKPPALSIELDGKPLRTPMKALLEAPTRALAEAMAEEWRAQGANINPFSMPLTRLANAAIDRVRPRRGEVIEAICAHGAHDLLCYRAQEPLAFVLLQQKTWDPLLEWAGAQLGSCFVLAEGVMPISQPQETLAALARRYGAFGDFQLAGLSNMASLSGSAILPLAVASGRLSAAQAWEAASLDESWNMRMWGSDREAKAQLAQRQREFMAAAHLLELLRAG